MDDDRRPITLVYETPHPATHGFARMPLPAILLVAVLVPGLSSSLIRGTVWRCVCLAPAIPVAFIFFGPVWGEVLFPSSSWSEFGLYPFVLTCLVVEIVSVLLALGDRKRMLGKE
jgi:hypothetical protein